MQSAQGHDILGCGRAAFLLLSLFSDRYSDHTSHRPYTRSHPFSLLTSNFSGAVRHHIYWQGVGNRKKRNKADNTTYMPSMFFIHQITRHGPRNGFRLCRVHQGFHIVSPTESEGDEEDDIDRLEKDIPLGHMEVVFVGSKPTVSDACEED